MSLSRSAAIALVTLWVATAGAAAGDPRCRGYLAFLGPTCAQWQSRVLPQVLPPSRGNAFADREDAALLGMKIFFDNRFSLPGSGVACASCHDPEHAFAEKKPRSHTIREADRNAPDLIDAAWYAHARFWDGKVDNLWSAPLYTLEADAEMGSTRLHVVHVLAAIYKPRYEKIFGPLPEVSDTRRFPEHGKPGSPEFDGMASADRAAVDEVYANVGKCLEAYLRKLAAGRSRFDAFMTGSAISLTPAAQRGMVAFTEHGCGSCHSGPGFTDEQFHQLDLPLLPGRPVDPGRRSGAAFARHWEFSSASRFADAGASGDPAIHERRTEREVGFRTPSLRNVALTGPYGHDGSLRSLEEAIDAHRRISPSSASLSAAEKGDIVEFLRSLNGRPPAPPWNYWPGG